ncbi:hypothetical protein [Paenibacillus segetis]|uniref:hypothetical protein n=1 Tax=Paenibacillus segetis TaxID=1325360 RepID=UPI0018883C18|nr:hypothetical protein [Paenibacillus segetis]
MWSSTIQNGRRIPKSPSNQGFFGLQQITSQDNMFPHTVHVESVAVLVQMDK